MYVYLACQVYLLYKCQAVPFYLCEMRLEPPGVILSDEKQVMSL